MNKTAQKSCDGISHGRVSVTQWQYQSMKCKGPRFNSSQGLQFFSLSNAYDRTKKNILYIALVLIKFFIVKAISRLGTKFLIQKRIFLCFICDKNLNFNCGKSEMWFFSWECLCHCMVFRTGLSVFRAGDVCSGKNRKQSRELYFTSFMTIQLQA